MLLQKIRYLFVSHISAYSVCLFWRDFINQVIFAMIRPTLNYWMYRIFFLLFCCFFDPLGKPNLRESRSPGEPLIFSIPSCFSLLSRSFLICLLWVPTQWYATVRARQDIPRSQGRNEVVSASVSANMSIYSIQ